MSCGCDLKELTPGQQDYKLVKHQAVRGVLQVIFQQDDEGNLLSSIQEVL